MAAALEMIKPTTSERSLPMLDVHGCPRYRQLQHNRNKRQHLQRRDEDDHVAQNNARQPNPKGGDSRALNSSNADATAPVIVQPGNRAQQSVREQTTPPSLDPTMPWKD